MAKKKSAPKKAAKKKPTKGKPATKKKTARPRGPRSQALPGMEQVRNVRLDRFCESISEGREHANRLRNEEKADMQGSLREMHDEGIQVYRHAGVELVRVPGEEKLRVRTTKETASDITDPEEADAAAEALPEAGGVTP